MGIHSLTGKEIADIVKGVFVKDAHNNFTDISTDSRNILSTELFIPLIGESFDGHNFITGVIEKGIKGVITQKDFVTDLDITIIKVNDTLKAYQALATYFRIKLNTFVIGITGSSGKTSTKEIAYAFFSQFFDTYKSQANFNNEVGVPLNLLNLKENHQIAIIEMGMRGLKQIEELANIARPNAGIITGIGSAHIELLGSVENIALAKWELAEYLNTQKERTYLAIPAYDPQLSELAKSYPQDKIFTIDLQKNENAHFYLIADWIENNKQFFSYYDNISKKELKASISVLGKHQISNTLLCIALAKCLNIQLPHFIAIDFENLSGRSEIFKINKATITNDSYNANPESMKAAIESFLDSHLKEENILVIGEMRELGSHSIKYHSEIGNFCQKFNFKEIIIIAENAKPIYSTYNKNNSRFFADNQLATEHLKNFLNQNVNIFFKASRGAKLEEIIEGLK